jgi:hypothetical protein
MTEKRARELSAHLFERLSGRRLATHTVADYFAQWLGRKKAEVSEGTARKYGEATRHFITFPWDGGNSAIWRASRGAKSPPSDDLATRLSVGSVNVALKIVRIVFGDAASAKVIGANEARLRPDLESGRHRSRREAAFHGNGECGGCSPWRAANGAPSSSPGFYAGGQRLGDVARLTWQNVDLENAEIRFASRKTGTPAGNPDRRRHCSPAFPRCRVPTIRKRQSFRTRRNCLRRPTAGALAR